MTIVRTKNLKNKLLIRCSDTEVCQLAQEQVSPTVECEVFITKKADDGISTLIAVLNALLTERRTQTRSTGNDKTEKLLSLQENGILFEYSLNWRSTRSFLEKHTFQILYWRYCQRRMQ